MLYNLSIYVYIIIVKKIVINIVIFIYSKKYIINQARINSLLKKPKNPNTHGGK